MLWVSLVLVVTLGAPPSGSTARPSSWEAHRLYWGMALVFWGSATFRQEPDSKHAGRRAGAAGQGLEPAQPRLGAVLWRHGVLNPTWLTTSASPPGSASKAWGATGLLLVFTLAQGMYLSRHLPPQDSKTEEAEKA